MVWLSRLVHAQGNGRGRACQDSCPKSTKLSVEYPYDVSFRPPAPVVPVQVGVPGSQSPIDLRALLDSGADVSVVPTEVVERLQLRRVDVIHVQGFGGEATETWVYAAQFALNQNYEWIGRAIPWAEPYAILGRGVMNHLRITLDGPGQITTIA
ncbi:MAG: hypothetical protein EXR55_02770 [Dehalococcoidia bacterium]|nr:hypothetical protein [Dehalococcoidia bacterium]